MKRAETFGLGKHVKSFCWLTDRQKVNQHNLDTANLCWRKWSPASRRWPGTWSPWRWLRVSSSSYYFDDFSSLGGIPVRSRTLRTLDFVSPQLNVKGEDYGSQLREESNETEDDEFNWSNFHEIDRFISYHIIDRWSGGKFDETLTP
jgi:hypothetical protein